MLFDQIKQDHISAFKAGDKLKKDILSIIISKCKYKLTEKNSTGTITDQDVLAIIEKTVKELNEEIDSFTKAGDAYKEKVENLGKQKEMISLYLPKKLTEEEIKDIINTLDDKTLPNIMKHFKTNYAGKCDMAKVSQIAKSFN